MKIGNILTSDAHLALSYSKKNKKKMENDFFNVCGKSSFFHDWEKLDHPRQHRRLVVDFEIVLRNMLDIDDAGIVIIFMASN